MKYYTGVGSRVTPASVLSLMRTIGYTLAHYGITGRSGSAEGADQAFEIGCAHACSMLFESYLPWNGFNDCFADRTHIVPNTLSNYSDAIAIARSIHPVYDRLSSGAKKLHTRNVYQVLGLDLQTPSEFLICYAKPTKYGVAGGTGTAWELAKRNGILCYNLWYSSDINALTSALGIAY